MFETSVSRLRQPNDGLDVMRLREKVEADDRVDPVTGIEQHTQVAGEDRRFSRNV